MAKLQKQIGRKIGDKEYSKYVLVIPESEIRKAEFQEGQEIRFYSSRGKIVLEKG